MITEPDVVITDYLLALECAVLAWLLHRRAPSDGTKRNFFVLFFLATGFAAALGGTVHGFFGSESSATGNILWSLSLLALGVTAFSMWSLCGLLLFSPRVSPAIRIAAGIELLLYAVLLLSSQQAFRIAIANYAPAVVALALSLVFLYERRRNAKLLTGAAGLALALVASYLQQRHVGLHPVYFNHNAVYHVLEALALLMVFVAARPLVSVNPSSKG